jgi:hypothetical protein
MSHRIMCGPACRASFVVLLLTCVAFLLFPASLSAKPRANEDGRTYCAMKDSEGAGEWKDDGSHRCCFWEDQGNGESLRLCLECDENWKNCKEVLGARRPGQSTGAVSNKRSPLGGNSGSGHGRVCCKLRGHYGARTQYRLTSRSVCLRGRGVPVGAKFCSNKVTPQPARICCRTGRSHALMPPQQCRARRGSQVSLKLCRKTERPDDRRQRRSR